MNRETAIGWEDFLELPIEEIIKLVLLKQRSRTGIFIADGNRRFVIYKTRFSPTSDEFYIHYAQLFIDSLRKALEIFFDHGLETLFFPLFGPSLIIRKNQFQSITIPKVYKTIFLEENWFRFFNEKGIRVKVYGDISQLERIDVHHLNMQQGIMEVVEKTASNTKHTLYFGFMSQNIVGWEMPQMVIDFYKNYNRAPTYKEMLELYYGEEISPVDFCIFSGKISGHRALPPLLSMQNANLYFFQVPGFLAFNTVAYRKILYDLLFVQNPNSIEEYSQVENSDIDLINSTYETNKNIIIGLNRKIGNLTIPVF